MIFLKWPEECNSLYNLKEPDWDLHDTYWREWGVYNQKFQGSRCYHISSGEQWVKNYFLVQYKCEGSETIINQVSQVLFWICYARPVARKRKQSRTKFK
jgi:hypothetical protein